MGCVVFDGAIPDDLERRPHGPGLSGRGLQRARRRRRLHGGLPARLAARRAARALLRLRQRLRRAGRLAPRLRAGDGRAGIELQHFLAHGSPTRAAARGRASSSTCTARRRARAQWHELAVLAFDHRVQFEELAARARRAAAERIARFKRLVAEGRAARGARRGRRGRRRHDPRRPLRRGRPARRSPAAAGWVARPVELPGSRPLALRGRRRHSALALRAWPTEHVAKCLVSYHPDDPAALRDAQLARAARRCRRACIATDRELLIEVIPPRELRERRRHAGARAGADLRRRHPPRLVEAAAARQRRRLGSASRRASRRDDPHLPRRPAARPGGERGRARARASRSRRRTPICKGFAVGRSIFADAAADWFAGRIGDDAGRRRRRRPLRAADRALARAPAPPRAARHAPASSHEGHGMTHHSIGFIGIGMMGHGMAKNLLAKGYPLTFKVNRNRARLADLLAAGAKRGEDATPRSPRAARHRLHLRHRLAAGRGDRLRRGRPARRRARRADRGRHLDRRAVVDRAHPRRPRRARARRFIDAPLARTPKEAEEGRLNTMVGAEPSRLRSASSRCCKAFCENIFHVGPPGPGHVLKLVNNMHGDDASRRAIAEAFAVAAKAGLRLDKLFDVVSAGGVNSRHLPDDGRPDAARATSPA